MMFAGSRRSRSSLIRITLVLVLVVALADCGWAARDGSPRRAYNGPYAGPFLNRVAFPIGGMGAGMVCLEGTGAISHVSVRNKMDFFHEPYTFAALCVKGAEGNVAKVLEGPVPDWKIFGMPRTGRGADRSNYGLPRFDKASFLARFPFGTVTLRDAEIPMSVKIVGWSPFTPGDPDNSSLPVGALEYRFENTSDEAVEAVFSYNTKNFMAIGGNTHFRGAAGNGVRDIENGFVLWQKEADDHPEYKGTFAIFTDDDATVVDHCWFKGGWWDPATLAWKNIQEARLVDNPPSDSACPGASLFVPFRLAPGEKKLVKLMFCWYVPNTTTRHGQDAPEGTEPCEGEDCCPTSQTYIPWYAGRFKDIDAVATYWRESYRNLRRKSDAFRRAFYDTTLPKEVVEAVAANLTILKSPTVLRQANGKLWCYEGCNDDSGCCHGSCTHVWNYAQAICHLFPSLERSLRQTEFTCSQDKRGHQTFRSNLPIRPVAHTWHAASDGQLGGIMKVYRDWRISGDTVWLKSLWPNVKQSLEYCIQAWDPRGRGVLEEPHHNTYDIEYWGPDGHCSSFYLGALTAAIEMGQALDDDVSRYRDLVSKGREFLETKLHNGEYFYHKVQTEGLNATFRPLDTSANGPGYNAIIATLNEQGPKYQYGTGCLSDGVLGFWIARACGLEKDIVDADKVRSNLRAIHKYNLKHDLSDHSNPQRPSYAVGKEGGLLLCTWPRGGKPALPFVYSDEVWTGIEYQVASHLMMEGLVDEGLEIVRACRDRYDGRVRNPFNEYECGHWYARAMSSYGLIQGLTGVRYDAVDKTLHIDSKMGKDFRAFLSTATGFGTVGLEGGKPFLEVRTGRINVRRTLVSGKEMSL